MAYEKKFEGMTSEEMLLSIDENFYKVVPTKRKLAKFTRVFMDKYCEERGIIPSSFASVRLSHSTDAKYDRGAGEVRVNNCFLKSFEHFKKTNNFYFVTDYFDSVLHELRHHEQFTSGNSDIHPIVRNAGALNRRNKIIDLFDKYSYFGHPLELDARHFAYEMLKKNEFLKPFLHTKEYINDELVCQVKDPFNYTALLKDKKLRGAKGITRPLKMIESSIKDIAIKNKLYYLGQKEEMDYADKVNNIILNQKIASEIAPSFYSDEFFETNPRTVDTRIRRQELDEAYTIERIYKERKLRKMERKAEKLAKEKKETLQQEIEKN